MDLRTLAEAYLAAAVLKPATAGDYAIRLRAHLYARPEAAMDARDVLPMHVDAILKAAPDNTARIVLARVLAGMFGWAEANDLIVRDPYRRSNARRLIALTARAHEVKPETLTAWDAADVRALLVAEGDPRWRAFWRFLGVTGARRGEAVGLTRENLRLHDRVAVLGPNVTMVGGRVIVEPLPKGHRRRRAYFGHATAAALDAATGDPWVFGVGEGRMHPHYVSMRFNRLAARAGLPRLGGPHGLRRTMGKLAEASGFPESVRSAALGHAPTLLGRYTPVSEGELRDLADALEDLLGPI